METYILLIIVPLLFALLFQLGKGKRYNSIISVLMFVTNTYLAVSLTLGGEAAWAVTGEKFHIIENIILIFEALIIVFLYYVSIKHKKPAIFILTVVQTVLSIYTVFFAKKSTAGAFNIDKLSLVMALIVNIVGSLIVMFANEYMDEYEKHRGMKSKQKLFYAVICIFLSAMNGLVFSDTMSWIYFFWEITTLASFILISYNGDEEAYKSGFRALFLNLIGGVAFSLGIIIFKESAGIETLRQIIAAKGAIYALPVVLLCIAGFAKSAQFPFQSWLLGAMVAPTPVSALLHSSTMVNAGVYLIIKLASAYANTTVGVIIALYGGFSFLICSAIAISQRNAKRVLAYSTIANLGLIISSAGMGTSLAISAAIMLLIFHAVSKALLFLCTGQTEHVIGSRDIEEMTGLINKAPKIAMLAALGMLSMIIPPFGVLITKWISIEASASNPIVTIFLVLGSACTTVYYVKWLGTILAHPVNDLKPRIQLSTTTKFPLLFLGAVIVVSSIFITKIYNFFVSTEVTGILHKGSQLVAENGKVSSPIGSFNDAIILAVVAATILLVLLVKKIVLRPNIKKVYMCGENSSESNDDLKFRNGLLQGEKSVIGNLYLSNVIDEVNITKFGYIVSITIILVAVIGGLR